MSRWRHVLVPIDLSTHSVDVVRAAKKVAFDRSEMTLLHVFDTAHLSPTASLGFNSSPLELHEHMMAELMNALREIRQKELGSIRSVNLEVVSSLSPSPVICRHAERGSVDLIVIGTQGRTGVSRLVLGSVAEQVVRSSPCPVLVVRARRRHRVSRYGRQLAAADVGMLEYAR